MATIKSLIIITTCALFGLVHSDTLQIKLSARDLPSFDPVGPSDPYAVIWYSEKLGEAYTKVGETKFLQDSPDVAWPEVFSFDYYSAGSEQRVKIDIMDDDFDEDDYMGLVEFYLNDVANSFGNILEKELIGTKEGGVVKITGEFPKHARINWIQNRVRKIDRLRSLKGNKNLSNKFIQQ